MQVIVLLPGAGMIFLAAVKAVSLIDEHGEWNGSRSERIPVTRHPTTFMHADNVVHVSAEDGGFFCDYYGEYRGGYPWIHPDLEALAKQFNGHWEWDNPASISFYAD